MGIGIDKHDQFVSRRSQTTLKRPRFSSILLLDQSNPWIVPCRCLDLARRIVGGTIVNYDHFQVAGVFCFEQGSQRARNYLSFIVGRDNNRR